ncbi:hypothetical protein [Rahnella aceris]|uniref:hypothetical protein n=1 Tax=Rahnella sp. (strain Y9602) TaxID=2703885 RepID=UPI001C26CE61|nr:hypothetical protein [Rahnella aceris]MBU9866793.1 hypothetical protein [Rahnella aceris]
MLIDKKFAPLIAGGVGLISSLIMLVVVFTGTLKHSAYDTIQEQVRAIVYPNSAANDVVKVDQSEYIKYLKNIENIQSTYDELIKIKPSNPESVQLTNLSVKIAILDKQISAINDAIMSSPEKALAIPMMRKDIDSTNKSLQTVYESMDHQLERAYTLFMWICGTLGVGMVAISISIFTSFKSASKS